MRTVISKDGTNIAYDQQGQGPVVILVLGALNKRGSGKKLAQLLAEHFTVVTYDRRGRGDSGEVESYSVEKEVDDIESLVDALGGHAYLYGHSSGAILALYAAEKLGSRIAGLALYEVPYNGDSQALKTHKTYEQQLAQLLAADKLGEAVALFVTSVGVSDKQIAAMRRLPMWKGLTAMAPTLRYDTIELMEKYPATHTSNVIVPVLVLYGAASPAFMGDTANALSRTLPQARLRSLENQTHDVKADVLAPVLLEFFRQQQ